MTASFKLDPLTPEYEARVLAHVTAELKLTKAKRVEGSKKERWLKIISLHCRNWLYEDTVSRYTRV